MRKLSLAVLLLFASNIFAVGRELAPRGSAPTSYPATNPQVAFAGGRFLTVWTEDMGNIGRHLMGAFSDASGQRVTDLAFPVMPQPFHGRPLHLVGTGDSYALFWKDPFENVLMTDIGLDGRVLRTTALAIPRNFQLHVGWNGSRFFAAVRHVDGTGYLAEGFLLARSGEVLRRGIAIGDAFHLHIVGDGDGFAATSTRFGRLRAHRISPGGDLTSYEISDHPNSFHALVSPMTNGNLLVVWAVGVEVRASVVTASGAVESRGTLVDSSIPLAVVHVRRAGTRHLVTYLSLAEPDNGLYTLTVHEDGTVTPAPERAAELAPRVYPAVITATHSPQTTLAVYSPPGVYPTPLLQVATADDATATEPAVVTIARSRQSQPILASAGGRVLAAWSDVQGGAAFVRTASLAPDGTPLTDTIAAPAYLSGRELAWNGTEYLVLQTRDQQLLASRVAYDGTPLDAEPLVLGQHSLPWWYLNGEVVWAGDRWAVAWEYADGIYFTTIRNGVAAPAKQLPLGELVDGNPVLSFNGSTLLLAWRAMDFSNCGFFPPCIGSDETAFAARITLDGALAGPPIALPLPYVSSIATSGSEFLVLSGTTATVIDAGASRILASRAIFNWPAGGDVTWDGSSYAVALRYLGAVWHVSVTHLDRDLNVVGPRRGTTTLPPDDFVPPSIAGSLVGVQEGDAVNGARAVVYRESDMQPLPAPPPAPLNVRATPTGDGRFEITWDESPGAELYRVFVFDANGIFTIEDVPATRPRSVILPYAGVRVIAFNAGGASDLLPRRRSVRR